MNLKYARMHKEGTKEPSRLSKLIKDGNKPAPGDYNIAEAF